MKVLLTGADGYIGSVLAPWLIDAGYDVTGLDAGFYRSAPLYNTLRTTPKTLNRDIRQLTRTDLTGFDAIIHLAELSNDPLGEQDPAITYEINHRGSVALASAARAAGIDRFIYTSSCSVYGAATADIVDETSETNPLTAYARCKALVERDVRALANRDFAPVFLRNATAFGASPRMRFDIVLNNLAGLAWTERDIRLTSDGTPWRPLVHVMDIAQAILACLTAPLDAIRGEIFNVGADDQNYRIRDVADIIGREFPDCAVSFGPAGGDDRSYRVSFAKIRRHLPQFRCDWSAERGAHQLKSIFSRVSLSPDLFNAPQFTRLRMLRQLIATQQIDERFFWRPIPDDIAPSYRISA